MVGHGDLRVCTPVCDVSGGRKKSSSDLENTTRHNGERYEVRRLRADDNPILPNKYYSSYQQFLSMDKRLGKDPDLKEANKATIEDLENHFVRKLEQSGKYRE